ncbi:MAG TPA: hypothetical protein VN258_18525 [Mobilitalea sp.]|nr:hypothetical protein [Mobilitalea sp.]
MERYIQIGTVNLKFNLVPHIFIAIMMLCISPLILGVENLDSVSTAKVLEMYVALLGIVLLTPIFLPEQNKDIRDLVEAKYTSATAVYLIRILEAGICLAILIGSYILILKNNQCIFPEWEFFLGTLAEALFLGGMGLCAYSLFDQIAIAYLLPMMYYIMAIGGGQKLLKDFYPFSMIYGSYQEKKLLAVIGFIMIVVGLSYPYISRKIIPRIIRPRIIRPRILDQD